MKKVLIIATISGFLPQFEKNDVHILESMGCEIHYASNFNHPVYTFNEKDLTDQGIIMHQIDIAKSPAKLLANLKAIRQLKRVIDENEIDMIHCHNPMGGVDGRIAAKLSKRKPYVIYTAHGFHFYKGASLIHWMAFYPVERFLSRYTDRIVTINREDYERAEKFPHRKNGYPVQIYGVGVDERRFCPKPKIAAPKRIELGIPAEAFHIVTAAELNDNKNQQVIIKVLARLKEKGIDDIYYSICGKGPNEQRLKKLIADLHMEGRIYLRGFRTDMDEILQTADCFAFPSYREGFGVAAIEALLCNVPLIVSDNRGTREYAVSGENGIVCKKNRVEDFAQAIKELYSNEELRLRMKLKCRQSAEKFTVAETEKTMKEVYEGWMGHYPEVSEISNTY